ncbi:hypothetical protein FHP29_19245 [Nocardioides albidus]|uniref:Uncharacterized protein n=1 Tax=Nocardioides albidus TaxID=1517589 RepID=A0A5C4VLW5_9ACTN|nr:hypothetical protein [Nocardioides albidus]TNM36299.1 hypothetical protein FHP29_19245 [Nocardioides albidus]
MKLLLVVLLFAAVTYLAVRWLQEHGDGGAPARRTTRPRPPSRPVAPDDDETFLRDLEWRRRQQERRKDQPQPPDSPET